MREFRPEFAKRCGSGVADQAGMTITKVLTPAAFVALIALSASPALAQRRDGGRDGRSRSYSGPRVEVRVGPSLRGYGYRPSYVRPYYGRPYYGSRYSRPFYSFRPRVNLGFGIWMGYPVAYPDYYYNAAPYGSVYPPADPYAYEPAPSYGGSGYPAYGGSNYPAYGGSNYPAYGGSGYPAQQQAPSVGVQRGQQSSEGGVSFEITPGNADVFVDGRFMGTAGEFDPTTQPLGVSAGRHRVEIRANGYRTMALDADVRPGEVIPFRGTLQRN